MRPMVHINPPLLTLKFRFRLGASAFVFLRREVTLIKVEITLTKGISGHISFMLQSQSLATQESAYLSFLNIRMLKIVLLFVGRDACSSLGNPQTPVVQRVDSTFYWF